MSRDPLPAGSHPAVGRHSGPTAGFPDQTGWIEVDGLTKTFGSVEAVRDLSFSVAPGSVTGFLGPNGAGKTTTLRMLLGLVAPTAGRALIEGRPYAQLPSPNDTVGAVLEASNFHPARTGRDHLLTYCAANGYPGGRAGEVLELVGLSGDGDRRVHGYSLGMRQRLGLAAALLGDPRILILDEPANGLDPDGIAWLRAFLRDLAGEGRTVLVSSHVLSEVEQAADRVVIIHQGRLVRQGEVAELTAETAGGVIVRSPEPGRLAMALDNTAAQVRQTGPRTLHVRGIDAAEVGRVAFMAQIELHELAAPRGGLEDAFFALTQGVNGDLTGSPG